MMSKGVVLIAHNNGKEDYYSMAVATAKRVNKYLDLPATLITSSQVGSNHPFDKVIVQAADTTNIRKSASWYNKGRYKVFDQTPYNDTILLDVDYLINSQQLLEAFKIGSDFICHRDATWLLESGNPEFLYRSIHKTLWATAIRFQKTNRVEQIFELMGMVENNYEHYASIYRFSPHSYRNDYALTIALKTANGHTIVEEDYYPWPLIHINVGVKVYREEDTVYTIIGGTGSRPGWLRVSGVDFHMLDKANFLEIVNG